MNFNNAIESVNPFQNQQQPMQIPQQAQPQMQPTLTSFEQTVFNMEKQLRADREAFGIKEGNNNRIAVAQYEALFSRPLEKHEIEMIQMIDAVEDYSWSRGKNGGLDTGFKFFNEAIEGGLPTAFILLAAAPNVGKSAFLLQLMKQVAEKNENVFCEYMSLDDSANVIMPRFIATDQLITIGQAKNPEVYKDEPEILEKRTEGVKNLYKLVNKFSLRDGRHGNTIESIEERIKQLRMTLPEGIRIVIGLDSFYDVKTEKKMNSDDVHGYVSEEVKRLTTDYDVTIIGTAHLRKNGNKRPVTEDLKEGNRLEYEVELLCMLYNEVGIKEEGADVYWLGEDEDKKMPVLEVRFAKNKLSDFKGTRFYEMIPAYSHFIESTEEGCKRYSSLIYGSRN